MCALLSQTQKSATVQLQPLATVFQPYTWSSWVSKNPAANNAQTKGHLGAIALNSNVQLQTIAAHSHLIGFE